MVGGLGLLSVDDLYGARTVEEVYLVFHFGGFLSVTH